MASHYTKKAKKGHAPTEDQDLENKTELCWGKNKNDSPETNTIEQPKFHNAKITLLHLPPEILETVFAYLPVAEVYSNVREVCHRLQDVVDRYIQAGKRAKQYVIIAKLKTSNHIHSSIIATKPISFKLFFRYENSDCHRKGFKIPCYQIILCHNTIVSKEHGKRRLCEKS